MPGSGRDTHWVKPQLVAEVSFSEWTGAGHVRHPVFQGLRKDKPARAITKETPVSATAVKTDRTAGKPARAKPAKTAPAQRSSKATAGKLTHPERVIDASTGLTKLDLARYYALVAPLLLRHLKARPVSFLRAPDGIEGERFFQKHLEAPMPGVRALPQSLDPGHAPLVEVPTAQAVLSAVQMNVVEFHTWNAVKTPVSYTHLTLPTKRIV